MISGPWIESKFAPASFATAFAISVFPVPGGPNRRTPFGGSIPRRSNSSACFSGSSIISRTLRSSSLSPPMSSYVTVGVRTSPSRTGSSFISMIVSSTIWTTPFGITLITMNGRAPPIRAIPGTITTSPFVRGRFRRPRFTKFSIPWPKLILWPSEMIGAIVTRSAAKTSAFLTSTLSPMETPTFRRGWRGRGTRRRRCAAPGGPRLSVNRFAGQGLALLDLGGLVDGEFAGLDGPNPAMRADDDFLADDEVRDRAFQVHLVGRDPVRPELAAAAEEPGGSADVHLRPVDRGHAHVPAELDVDLAALQGPAKLPTAGEFELLRGRPPAHAHAPADVDLLPLEIPADGEGP